MTTKHCQDQTEDAFAKGRNPEHPGRFHYEVFKSDEKAIEGCDTKDNSTIDVDDGDVVSTEGGFERRRERRYEKMGVIAPERRHISPK